MKVPPGVRRKLGTERVHIPSVMIDYIAVDKSSDGTGLGHRVFEWVESRACPLNETIGVRFIVLGVRAENWGAYRVYAKSWGFNALPVDGRPAPNPDAQRPDWLSPTTMIHMFYDLVEKNGAFEPVPSFRSEDDYK